MVILNSSWGKWALIFGHHCIEGSMSWDVYHQLYMELGELDANNFLRTLFTLFSAFQSYRILLSDADNRSSSHDTIPNIDQSTFMDPHNITDRPTVDKLIDDELSDMNLNVVDDKAIDEAFKDVLADDLLRTSPTLLNSFYDKSIEEVLTGDVLDNTPTLNTSTTIDYAGLAIEQVITKNSRRKTKCRFCNKTYVNTDGVLKHMKRKHTDVWRQRYRRNDVRSYSEIVEAKTVEVEAQSPIPSSC